MRSFTAPLLVVAPFAPALCLEGCAMPARSTAMAVRASPELAITAHDNYYRRLAVTSVEGGRRAAALERSELDTTIEARGSAGVSDTFLGPKRLRLADEASIRANIACLLKVLRAGAPAPEFRRELTSGEAARIERYDG